MCSRGIAIFLSHQDPTPEERPVHFSGQATLHRQQWRVGFLQVPHFSHAVITDGHQHCTAKEYRIKILKKSVVFMTIHVCLVNIAHKSD